MAKSNDRKTIAKENWVSSFSLIGRPKITDYTFKINESSEKSDWIYNSLNLGVDCGENYGTVYCELMGGYSSTKAGTIYAHGKNDDGTDDFKNKIEVAWDDRFNDSILSEIGDSCFISIGLERTDKGKNYVKKFLSAYDAIAYVKECLKEDMVINVYGSLRYSMYQDKVQIRKNISKIELSKAEPDKFRATFKQSVLLDQDSVNIKNVDQEKGVLYVDGRVLDYVKEYNGLEVKGQFPYMKTFELDIKRYSKDEFKMMYEEYLKVKKNITQVNFLGFIIEGGAIVPIAIDEMPPDVQKMVKCKMITMDRAYQLCSNGKREIRMILDQVDIKATDDGVFAQKFEDRYTEDDLSLDYLNATNQDEMDDNPDSNPPPVASASANNMEWLKELMGNK